MSKTEVEKERSAYIAQQLARVRTPSPAPVVPVAPAAAAAAAPASTAAGATGKNSGTYVSVGGKQVLMSEVTEKMADEDMTPEEYEAYMTLKHG